MEMPIDLILVVPPEPILLEASPSTVMPGATKGTLHHLCLSILQRSGVETHRGLRLLSPCRMARLPTTFSAGAKSLEDRSQAHLQSGRIVGAVGGGRRS